MTTEDDLRERLRMLAAASGVEVPRLEMVDDAAARLLPARIRGWGNGEDHIAASEDLLDAGPAERTWHLASCLGYWTSPVPRRRRRQGWAMAGVFVVPYLGFGLFEISTNNHLPKWVTLAIGTTLAALVPAVLAVVSRRFHRALDASGRDVLRRAGYEPAALARQVFGAQADPPWWKRLYSREPLPSERVGVAGGSAPTVHPPLY